MKFSIIISNTKRSIYYLKKLSSNNLAPNEIIYLDDNSRKINSYLLKKNKIFSKNKIKIFSTNFINKKVENYIMKLKTKYFVYSGYPGIVIKNKKILNEKAILHSHPGKLPFYKGSTTIYYSLLNSNKIYCTTLILREKIDTGPIIYVKEYPKPKILKTIDDDYDNFIRSENIVYVLKNISKLKAKRQKINKLIPYFVIHPILRSCVFNLR